MDAEGVFDFTELAGNVGRPVFGVLHIHTRQSTTRTDTADLWLPISTYR